MVVNNPFYAGTLIVSRFGEADNAIRVNGKRIKELPIQEEYELKEGESLEEIAAKVYKGVFDPCKWWYAIYFYNSQLINPFVVYPTTLRIPNIQSLIKN